MRKILFIMIGILLLICTIFVIKDGTSIGGIEILGIEQIVQKDEDIDSLNDQLSTLVSVAYPARVSLLQSAASTLQETKEEYEEQAVLLADSKYYGQSETYKPEFLYIKYDGYAKDNYVEMRMDIVSNVTAGLYDLNCTITGLYSDVIQFIYDIENDSKLGFKIENFSMVSGPGVTQEITDEDGNVTSVTTKTQVVGTFSCTGIKIDLGDIDTTTTNTKQETSTNTNETDTDENDTDDVDTETETQTSDDNEEENTNTTEE